MTSEEEAKADEIYNAILGTERNSLVARYGNQAERIAKGRAIKQAQKLAEKKMDSSKDKLREMVKSALMGTNEELKGGQKKLDVNKDGKISGEDFAMLRKGKMEEAIDQAIVLTDTDHENLMKNGSVAINVGGQTVVVALKDFQVDMEDVEDYNLDEDLDLGHEDDEPHMIKGELYRIGKYAMELYQMVDQFEGEGEVDFPAWWQAKITTAKNMVSSAKHYLEFELKEPEVDAMVGVAAAEDIIPNVPTKPLEGEIEEIGMFHDPIGYKKSEPDPKDLIYTKEYKGDGVYDILKNGEKIKTIKGGEGEANAYINKLKRELEEGLPKEYEIGETLAQRIAKKLKEDVVKGSNIRKDSKGKWRVLSGKTGKMWPQTYDSKADAEDALQAYHATKG